MGGLTTENAAALVSGAAASGTVLAEILQPCLVAGEHLEPAAPGKPPVTVAVSERDLDGLVESGRGRRYQAPAEPAVEQPVVEAAAATDGSESGTVQATGEQTAGQTNEQPAAPPAAQ